MEQNKQVTDELRVSQQDSQEKIKTIIIGNYQLGKTIGRGTFGKVKQAIHLPTQEKVAIKIIDKKSIQDEEDQNRILRQVDIMKIVRHPNIIHLYEIIETSEFIYLVTQFAEQGQLFKLMTNEGRLKQRAAGRIFIQILNAVEYLHRLNIVHRDLKPQNILLDVDFNIKLIDYGLSNYHEEGKKLNTACGSPCYAPPEMVSGNTYDGKIGDIWSLGIIFYGMVCGSLPFQQKTTKQLYKKVIQGFYYIPSDISTEAIQVIQKMLVTDPTKRIKISEIRKLKFFKQINKIQPQIIGIIVGFHPMPIDNEILQKMKKIKIIDKDQVQDDLKENQHNDLTTMYYLLQKKVLRQGGKTIVDLQIFLESHEKYKQEYGKHSLDEFHKKEKKQAEKIEKQKIIRKGLSKQKYNKDQFKLQTTPKKFYSNQKARRRLMSTLQQKSLKKTLPNTARGNSKQKQKLSLQKTVNLRLNTQRSNQNLKRQQRSVSVSKGKKIKLIKSPTKNLAINLWHAYFQNPLQMSKGKQKKKKLNPKQQQKMLTFNNNVKKLKQGFLKLPQMDNKPKKQK